MIEQLEIDRHPADFISEYAITRMISVYHQWFLPGRREPLKTISDIISIMFFNEIANLLERYRNGNQKDHVRN